MAALLTGTWARLAAGRSVRMRSFAARGQAGCCRGCGKPATLGQIGFEGRLDYAAIGPAPNLAARLCDKAAGGENVAAFRLAPFGNEPDR